MNQPRAQSRKPEARSDRGIALIVAMLIMVLLSALGLSFTMVTMTEARVAHSYSSGSESFYAADAALELAMNELACKPDWNRVLDGSVTSSFVDPGRVISPWPGGRGRTSTEATALVTCARTSCSTTDMDAQKAGSALGAEQPAMAVVCLRAAVGHEPVWLDRFPPSTWRSGWADDPQENDDNPLVDGDESRGPNPGRGVLTLRVQAYGMSTVRAVEATVARAGNGVRVVSWREIR